MDKDRSNLIWVDLEMTGLNVDLHTIIEIAIIVTDKDLTELGRWPSGQGGQAIYQPEDVLEKMDAWNRKTHTETGLLQRVRQSSVNLHEAEKAALTFIQEYCPQPGPEQRKEGCPLAGNSIGQDRKFLDKHMPKLDQGTSYRNIDVSTIKELVKRWYPSHHRFDKEKWLAEHHPNGKHAAMGDLEASIAELKHYRELVFKLAL